VPTVLKSGSLNLLEPSGPVQACNGIALPLPFYCFLSKCKWAKNKFWDICCMLYLEHLGFKTLHL